MMGPSPKIFFTQITPRRVHTNIHRVLQTSTKLDHQSKNKQFFCKTGPQPEAVSDGHSVGARHE